jgi:phosphomevalonate kinase
VNVRSLSAPGKLFVSGEYAVLWGGTARVAAVGPRAQALMRRREDREVHLVTSSGRRVGDLTPLGVHWRQEVGPAFHFAARAIDDVVRLQGQEGLGFSVALAPSPTAPNGHKLGMGGSARTTLLAVEAARSALDLGVDALKLSLVSHASAQGGKGSGADVAAIFAGGIVRYRRYPVEALAQSLGSGAVALERAPAVDLWRNPLPATHLTYAFTGESASTPGLIARAEQRLSPEQRAAFTAESDALGDKLEDGLRRGDFERIRETVGGLRALLARLGPLETEATRRLLALAALHGAAGKISGAGGGDGVLLFSPDARAQTELVAALRDRGLYALPLELQPGMRGEAVPDPLLDRWLAA